MGSGQSIAEFIVLSRAIDPAEYGTLTEFGEMADRLGVSNVATNPKEERLLQLVNLVLDERDKLGADITNTVVKHAVINMHVSRETTQVYDSATAPAASAATATPAVTAPPTKSKFDSLF